MVTFNEFKEARKIVEAYEEQISKRQNYFRELKKEIDEKGVSKFAYVNKEMSLCDTFASVRLLNIIRHNSDVAGDHWDMKVKDLESYHMSQFVKFRGVGKGIIKELKELCFYAGVSLQP